MPETQKGSGTVQPLKHQNNRSKFDHNISQRFKVQGVTENPKKRKAENWLSVTQKVNEVLNLIGEKSNLVELKRLGKFDEKSKTAELAYNLLNWTRSRFDIGEGHGKTGSLGWNGHTSPSSVIKDDAINENLILKKRRDLLNEGVAREKMKIGNLELFSDGVKVDINSEPDAKKGKWLAFLNVLLFRARYLINSERRFKLANAVLTESVHVLCICETWLTKEVQNSEMKLGNYQIYRADRPPETDVLLHSASLITVKNSLDSRKLDTALPDCCIACNMKLAEIEIIICVLYNPPEDSMYT